MILPIIVKDYLKERLGLPVYNEEPEKPPGRFCIVVQTSSGRDNFIDRAVIAVQSFGGSLAETMKLNERVVAAMSELSALPEISRCQLNSDYDFTDTTTKRHRYQAVFDIIFYR
jgi:hypothetical protein